MLNVYRIPAKEDQVVESSAADKISLLKTFFWKYLEDFHLILRDYKKLKSTEINRFTIYYFFKLAVNLSDNCRIICTKTNM